MNLVTEMKIYYAHPITIYGTPQEKWDVAMLNALGFEVLNPNSPENEAAYHLGGMAFFENVVKSCEALAFRAFPDGSIPAGIAREIVWANEMELPVFELPTRIVGRTLSVEVTRAFLKESGRR